MTQNISLQEFATRFTLHTQHDRIMLLNIFVDDDHNYNDELRNKYFLRALEHNLKIYEDPFYYDSGFDLFLPRYVDDELHGGLTLHNICSNKVDFRIRCSAKMVYVYNMKSYDTGYYIYPRSSISKTPLRLANNTGIIDAGYRGHIIGMFDNLKDDYYVEPYTRLIQICAPNLVPIYVNIVSSIDELGPATRRGDGGFGSTGK
jgi:dUTPase